MTLPPKGDWDSFGTAQQVAVNTWLAQVVAQAQAAPDDDTRRKVGLWVRGSRASGTTTLASTAADRAYKDADCGITQPEYITAYDASELVKQAWNEAKNDPLDDAVWLEGQVTEKRLDFLWDECDLLWLDDLHLNAVSGTFLQNHLFPRLERRVKAGLPTVISTSLTDRNLGDVLGVIQAWFVVVDLRPDHGWDD